MTKATIPHHLVDRLVAVGKSSDPASVLQELIPADHRARFGYIMRLRPEEWKVATDRLAVDELGALVRALTVAEAILPDWLGGSVSAVIWTYREFQQRCPGRALELADWVLAHTRNPYAPFRRCNFRARSLAELRIAEAERLARRRAIREAEEAREREAKRRRAEKATRDLVGAIRRGDVKAVEALLAKGADPHARDGEGRTALEYARQVGRPDIIARLKERVGGGHAEPLG